MKKFIRNSSYLLNTYDGQLHFKIVGEGEAVLLLHGNRQSHLVFAKLSHLLKRQYCLIQLDTPGHGASVLGVRRLTMEQIVDDVAFLLKRLEVKKIKIIGFSDGANIALEFAAKYSEKTKAVIAISPNLHPEGLKWWWRIIIEGHHALLSMLIHFKLPFQHQKQLTELMLYQSQLVQKLHINVTSPILILSGTHDLIKIEHLQEIATMFPHAIVKVLKNTHHLSLFRETARYSKIIEGFLAYSNKQ